VVAGVAVQGHAGTTDHQSRTTSQAPAGAQEFDLSTFQPLSEGITMPPGERKGSMLTPPGAGNAEVKNEHQITSNVTKSFSNFELTMPPGTGNVPVLAGDQQPPTPPGAGNAKILDPDATMTKATHVQTTT